MKSLRSKKLLNNFLLKSLALYMWITPVLASTTSKLPFTSALKTVQDAIKGPFLMSASIILIVITCILLAFGEWGDGFKKIINIVFWLAVAFGVTSFISTLFGAGAIV